MEKLLETKVNLWMALHGKVIPQEVMREIFNGSPEASFDIFNDIYLDKNKNILLALMMINFEDLKSFWNDVRPRADFPSRKITDFLLSPDYENIKEIWRAMLLFRGMEAKYSRFLILLSGGLYYDEEVDHQVLLDALANLDKELYSPDVYYAFCIIAMHFECFEEEDLPIFQKVFDKFRFELKKN